MNWNYLTAIIAVNSASTFARDLQSFPFLPSFSITERTVATGTLNFLATVAGSQGCFDAMSLRSIFRDILIFVDISFVFDYGWKDVVRFLF